MATVFWNRHGISFIDYLGKDKTITGVYYTPLLNMLKREVAKKTATFEEGECAVHQDNVQSQIRHGLNSRIMVRIDGPPDLVLCNFFLFLKF